MAQTVLNNVGLATQLVTVKTQHPIHVSPEFCSFCELGPIR
jgi:hypothetical protein